MGHPKVFANIQIFIAKFERLMKGFKNTMISVWHFYRDGFRNMTWGRPLVWLILLKVFILFAILRVFFFKPALSGLDEEQRSRVVGERIVDRPVSPETGIPESERYNP